MIEKFTPDELDIIRKEMKAHGYITENTTKAFLLEKAKREAGSIAFIKPEIKKALYDIADCVTSNYTVKKSKSCGVDRNFKNNHVPDELKEDYLKVLMDMCIAVKPYLKNDWNGGSV